MRVDISILFVTTVVTLFSSSTSRMADGISHWVRCQNMLKREMECLFNDDCGSMEVCRESKCVSACRGVECGVKEGCQIIDHHKISCECLPGFKRGSRGKCVSIKVCVNDDNCDFTEECRNGRCISVCLEKTCGSNEGCQIIGKHVSSCECVPNYARNSRGVCIPNKICFNHEDCELSEICSGNRCVNACSNRICSKPNEACQVNNRHSSSCHCSPGYNRNLITKQCDPNCILDSDCPSYQECQIIDFAPTCQCISGYLYDKIPTDPCLKMCTNDSVCENEEKCDGGKCKGACASLKCGDNAECNANLHIGTCSCLSGYIGDPLTRCGSMCSDDGGCIDSEKCDGTMCFDPCTSLKCGVNSYCSATGHAAKCLCEPGYAYDASGVCS